MPYLSLLAVLFLTACGNYSANVPTLKPYKMDIQQGNVVTPKMMMQLRPGMTKSQVRFIMGTPLLVDSFHGDRWDYFYQMRKDGKIIEQRRVILEFDGDNLAHVRGDVIPAGSDPAAATQPNNTAPRPVVKPAKEKDKGLLDKLKFWGEDEEAKPAKARPAEPQPAPAKPEAKPEPKPEPKTEPKQAPAPAKEPQSASAPAPAPEAEAPAPAPEPVKAEPEKEPVKAATPKPEQTEEKKGWLDKLKFWGDDDKKPATAPESKPVEASKLAPARIEPRAEPKVEAKPEPVKAEPPKTEPRPAAAEPAPAPRRAFKPDSTPKQAPKPPADLPQEDAPEFFEKMLEKIGF